MLESGSEGKLARVEVRADRQSNAEQSNVELEGVLLELDAPACDIDARCRRTAAGGVMTTCPLASGPVRSKA